MRSTQVYFSRRRQILLLLIVLTLSLSAGRAFAQATAFTYQGKLTDSNLPANGSYDFQFKLFDALSSGTQQGPTVSVPAAQVTNGIFTVILDFGSGVFPGGDRFLEIAVRPAGGAFTPLSPRQQVTSTPYALRSLNATAADGLSLACVNCITSSQIQSVQGSQITGAIPVAGVPAGSGNYIQNTNAQQQGAANFNITGNGTAAGTLSGNFVNATSKYKLNGNDVFSVTGGGSNSNTNTFVGVGSGASNTPSGMDFSGNLNSFFGSNAGNANTTGQRNTFLGQAAGYVNNTGFSNTFVGDGAGFSNTTGNSNSFFGDFAGSSNTSTSGNSFFGSGAGNNNTVCCNAFFGDNAGASNTSGTENSFFGYTTGTTNTSGTGNSSFGYRAGNANTTECCNALFGDQAGVVNTTFANSFFGYFAGKATVTGCCNAFFGSSAGINNTTGHNNAFFGTDIGSGNTMGSGNSFVGNSAGNQNRTGNSNTFIGSGAGSTHQTGDSNTALGANTVVADGLSNATVIGANASVTQSNTIALGRSAGQDTVQIPGVLNVAGALNANGSSLTNLNAINITAGTLSNSRLSVPLSLSGNSASEIISATNIGAGVGVSGDGAGGGIGVYGSGGFGIYGASFSGGTGVYGVSTTGTFGVQGESFSSSGAGVSGVATSMTGQTYGLAGATNSPDGAGVLAQGSGATGTALEIDVGAIRVRNAGIGTNTTAFIQVATAANMSAAHRTTIDHPMTNSNPNVILIVTPNYNPGGVGGTINNHPIGLFYNGVNNKWEIFNQDFGAMTVNAAFNVLIIKP